MSASIRFNGSPGPLQIVAGLVTLSNFNNTGVNGWHWELLDRPLGSAAVIGSPFLAAPSFTADVPGSYRVRLRTYLDAGRTVLDASDIQITFIRYAVPFDWRKPAAGETTEVDTSRGWATARDEFTGNVQTYMVGGLQTAWAQQPTIELGGNVFSITQGGGLVFRFNGVTGRPEMEDGTEASPGLIFRSDTNTGIFRVAADSLSISAGGDEAVRFSLPTPNNAQVLGNIPSNAAVPSFGFIGDPTTGISHPTGQAVGILSFGGEAARITRNGSDQPQILMTTGSDPTTRPHYSFLSNFDTGMSFADGGLAFYADGPRPLLLTGIAGVPRAIFQPGTAGNPSIAFEGDQTTGVFRAGAGIYGITTSGTERVRFQITTSVLSTHWTPDATATRDLGTSLTRWRNAYAGLFDATGGTVRADVLEAMTDGSALSPSIRWGLYGDNGFFGAGADRFSATVDGVEVTRWRTTGGTTPKFLLTDGTLADPSLAFISDENTGLRRQGADVSALVSGGVDVARFSAPGGLTPQVLLTAGTAAAPSLGFLANTDTGLFDTTALGVSGVGFSADGLLAGAAINSGGNVQLIAMAGTLAAPGLVVDQFGSGFYSPGGGAVSAVSGGQEAFRWTNTPQTLFADGAVGTPAITFQSDPNTGIYRTGVDSLGIAASGIIIARFTAAAGANPQAIFAQGGASAPSIAYTGGTNTGFYFPSSASIAITQNGTNTWVFENTTGSLQAQFANAAVWAADGTAAAPSYTFNSDRNTGIYRVGTDVLGISTGGAIVARFERAPTVAAGTGTGLDLTISVAGITGTAGYDAMHIDVTGAATGSGDKNLLRLTEGGAARLHVQQNGRIRGVDGTAALPTYSFINDPNSGIYERAADTLTFALNATDEWEMQPASGFYPLNSGRFIGDSNAAPFAGAKPVEGAFIRQTFGNLDADPAFPAFSFDGDTQTGMYHDGSTAFTQQGTAFATFNGAANAAAGVIQGIQFFPQLANTGTAGFDAFLINVGQPLASGSGVKRIFLLEDSSTERFAVLLSGQVQASSGAVGAPGYSFLGDATTGIYRPGASQVAITTGGTLRMNVGSSTIIVNLPFLQSTGGGPGAPVYSFNGDTNTGMYRSAASTIAFATGGTLRFSIDTTNVISTLPFLGPNGSAGAPTYSFSGDTDNGLYYVTTNEVAMSAGGTAQMRWTTTATYSTQPVEFAGATIGTPTTDTVRLGVPNDVAGRPRFLALKDPYFGENFLATAFHDRQKFFLLPSGTTTMVNAGFQFQTSGTVAYVTPTGTSFMTACQKNSFVTGAVSGNTADIHCTTPIVAQGDATSRLGFMFHARFAVGSDYTSNTRLFVGLINTTATLAGGTNPSALNGNRLVGVGASSGSATLFVYTNDAGGAPQATSTGLTIAANDAFDVWIWMPPASSTRYVYVNRINGAAGTYSGNSFSFPPGANQWLYPHSWIATAEAAAKTLYVMRWAIEAGQ